MHLCLKVDINKTGSNITDHAARVLHRVIYKRPGHFPSSTATENVHKGHQYIYPTDSDVWCIKYDARYLEMVPGHLDSHKCLPRVSARQKTSMNLGDCKVKYILIDEEEMHGALHFPQYISSIQMTTAKLRVYKRYF